MNWFACLLPHVPKISKSLPAAGRFDLHLFSRILEIVTKSKILTISGLSALCSFL